MNFRLMYFWILQMVTFRMQCSVGLWYLKDHVLLLILYTTGLITNNSAFTASKQILVESKLEIDKIVSEYQILLATLLQFVIRINKLHILFVDNSSCARFVCKLLVFHNFFQKNNKWCHWSLEFTTYLFRILRQLLSHHHVWYLECCGNICIIFFAPYKMNANSTIWQPHHLLYGISNYFLFSSWVVVVFLVVEENDDGDGLQMNEWDSDEPKSILMHRKKYVN